MPRPQLDYIVEKYLSLSDGAKPTISVDYGVMREGTQIQQTLRLIEEAIETHQELAFSYRNAHGETSLRTVQPFALRFKWYAWYLFAIDTDRQAVRTFKVARMSDTTCTGQSFTPLANAEHLLKEQEAAYVSTCEMVEVWCDRGAVVEISENFPETVARLEQTDDGHYLLHLHVPPLERQWQALLLSMGSAVKVLSPTSYRDHLIEIARAFLSNYDTELS